ncbi:hypothetical protein, partial [Pseudoalteromonas sp. NJ631]|uniref:hypothetical protein n=1 Tax=Pseudoalteromonas sp. NJ631 TaxID=493915 RepID=UPI001E40C6CC
LSFAYLFFGHQRKVCRSPWMGVETCQEDILALPSMARIKARPCASRSFILNDEKERTKKTSPQHHT